MDLGAFGNCCGRGKGGGGGVFLVLVSFLGGLVEGTAVATVPHGD